MQITVDCQGLIKYSAGLKAASKDLRKELVKFLNGLGVEFLNAVQDEIISRGATDTRQLLESFSKGAAENIWICDAAGLKIELGSETDYASAVNDGHVIKPHFVPGHWNGGTFVYEEGAKTGMMLHAQRIPGVHYFEAAISIMERLAPKYMEKKLDAWLKQYLGG